MAYDPDSWEERVMRWMEQDLELGLDRMTADARNGWGTPIDIAPAPTRAEAIKHIWDQAGIEIQVRISVERVMPVMLMPTREIINYALVRYGDEWCVECEGVIVQRTPVNR